MNEPRELTLREMEEAMRSALALAREAAGEGEIPVGALVLGPEGEVLGRGQNRRETGRDATAHAEIEAIRQACAARGSWRLNGCTLVVTLEPCPMCAGALIMAEMDGCVFGASDPRQGCCGSVYTLPQDPAFYHRVRCAGGVMEQQCAALLQAFFSARRP